ncbi:MAG: hypothetical protein C0508_17215 [Cyanobacteria bacterium PR.023]|nr:hypothetical protein [Cyanobacteria bacterium PR.023]MDQ5937137.1 hypothetical protein [Cyanobacteriota bacterium erpe_2018_sw_21hr_WHONDRS-SW48-000092_B_bin.40]
MSDKPQAQEMPETKIDNRNLLHEKPQTQEDKLSAFTTRLVEAADQRAVMMNSNGSSWKANRLVLEAAGIDAPRVPNAAAVEDIPGMQKLPPGEKPKPGDVYTTGADAKHPNGYSFIVNAEGRAVSDHMAKFPDLNQYKDVKHFRKVES